MEATQTLWMIKWEMLLSMEILCTHGWSCALVGDGIFGGMSWQVCKMSVGIFKSMKLLATKSGCLIFKSIPFIYV